MSAIAGSRSAAWANVPWVGVPPITGPSERGNISYQEPYSARGRSTHSSITGPPVTRRRTGWAYSTRCSDGDSAGAIRPVRSRSWLRRAAAAPRSASRCSAGACSATSSSSRARSEEHTSELQSRQYLVCRLLLEKKKKKLSQAVHHPINCNILQFLYHLYHVVFLILHILLTFFLYNHQTEIASTIH